MKVRLFLLMKPKVLHVIDHTAEGGAQVVVRQLIENLGSQFAFTIAVLGRSGRFSEAYRGLGIGVLELSDRQGRWNPFSIFRLIKAIRRDGYDLVHVHLFKSSILGVFAARCTRRKVILHDHNSINPRFLKFYLRFPARSIYLLLYRFVLHICHRIVVLTPSASKIYHEIYRIDLKKIAVVANGVDLPSVSYLKNNVRESIHYELGLPFDTQLVIMAARLEPEKDWITFLNVAQYVPKLTRISCAFLVIGIGSQEHDLRTYVATNRIDRVYFLGYRDDVLRLMAGADVFLLTSRFEPFGIVVLEAMMIGCPVVATRSGGPESILTHEFNGVLSDVGDVEHLSQQVVATMQNETLRRLLIRNARETVVELYNIQRTTSLTAEIYKQILSQ